MIAALFGLLGSSALGQGASVTPPPLITLSAQPEGRFLLKNGRRTPQPVTLDLVAGDTGLLRRESVLNGQCRGPARNIPGAPEAPTVTLDPEASVCLWVRTSAVNPAPSTAATAYLRVRTAGPDAADLLLPLSAGLAAATRDVPADPQWLRDTDDRWDETKCSRKVPFTSAAGQKVEACLDADGKLDGLTGKVAPDLYRNATHFTTGTEAATATLVVRRPWWHAALAILAGLLLPPLLGFLARRRREKEELKFHLAGLQLNPAHLPALVPSTHGPVPPFRLDLDPGLLRTPPSLLQPMSDVRHAYTALAQWRELGQPRDLLGQLQGAITDASAALGPVLPISVPVLAFVQDIRNGQRLGLPLNGTTRQFEVPADRVADVVASLEEAQVLAQTVARWAPDVPANAPLKAFLTHEVPASASAADLRACTNTLIKICNDPGGEARSELPSHQQQPWHTDYLTPRPSLSAQNVAFRVSALPLIAVTALLAMVVGLNELWADPKSAWGARGVMDYALAAALGAGAYTVATLLQSEALAKAVNLLSGSVRRSP
ncbi:hypothetical protein C8263_16680 [Deinococcus arcticus]|uniref:Uncharacterized protein n=1 Tax=Deinococcus arcticus TaxID=2136176 RepID=A0A2T3W450_9DEIO|nr:hypothetical protein C8263_16680 [Deinococcus arcticus]